MIMKMKFQEQMSDTDNLNVIMPPNMKHDMAQLMILNACSEITSGALASNIDWHCFLL